MPRGVYERTDATRAAISAARQAYGGSPCKEGCSCKRHSPPLPTKETVARRAATLTGHVVSEETKQKISAALTGRRLTLEQRLKRSEIPRPPRTLESRQAMSRYATEHQFGKNFRGGATGDDFERVLSPAGFVREFIVQHGPGRGQSYHLDFAHVEGKINIELDGLFHFNTPQQDAARDSWLRSQGWKVIRIVHR